MGRPITLVLAMRNLDIRIGNPVYIRNNVNVVLVAWRRLVNTDKSLSHLLGGPVNVA